MRNREPIFNVPGPVLLILGVMIAVHVGRQYLSEESALWWLVALAFIPGRYTVAPGDLPGGEIAGVTSFLTHLFVHADTVHLAVNSAWLLAFGTPLAKRLGWRRFYIFAACCGVAGALTFLILHPGLMAPVIGASGAIAGLMGGVLRFLFPAIDSHSGYLLRENPAAIPAMPLPVALRDKRLLSSTAAFVALNLLAIVGLGALMPAGTIAWEAHLGGYFFGLLCFGFFDIAPQHASPIPSEN